MQPDDDRTMRHMARFTLTDEQREWAHEQLKAIFREHGQNASELARQIPGNFSQQHVSQVVVTGKIGYPFAKAIAAYRNTTIESMGKSPNPATPRLRDRLGYSDAERDARMLPGAHRIPESAWQRAGDTQTAVAGDEITPEAIRDLARVFADHFLEPAQGKPAGTLIETRDSDTSSAFHNRQSGQQADGDARKKRPKKR